MGSQRLYSLSAFTHQSKWPVFLYARMAIRIDPPTSNTGICCPTANWADGGRAANAQWSAKAQFLYRQGSSKETISRPDWHLSNTSRATTGASKLGRRCRAVADGRINVHRPCAAADPRAARFYAYLPNTEIDGIHLQHQLPVGDWRLNLQGSYGQRTYHSQQFLRELRDSVGIGATLLNPQTSLHLAARTLMLGYQSPGPASATQLIRSVAAAQGRSDIAAE